MEDKNAVVVDSHKLKEHESDKENVEVRVVSAKKERGVNRSVSQPNQLTLSQYSFSVIQKNILYHMISGLQEDIVYKKEGIGILNENLLKEKIIEIPLKVLDENRNYKRIIEQAKDMMTKQICFMLKDNSGRDIEINTSIIASVLHTKGTDSISILIPSMALPQLINTSIYGFTKYNLSVALDLNSFYSKRIYELCCKWKNVGGFSINMDKFRQIMNISASYKNANIKSRILDKCNEELKEKADLYYEYTLSKKGRSYDGIKFKIINKTKVEQLANDSDSTIYNYLYRYGMMVYGSDLALKFAEAINIKDRNTVKLCYHRLKSLDDELSNGSKTKEDLKKLTRFALKEDYNIVF